ncbi:MAG: thiamine pyrophosphate-binding protein, partial [Chloroflexi bacterium]|nr:thiamine pyrophosphate-binding protein [Chloroflexota bacterium]
LVTLAPGITNAINGLAHAWLDHVPLLIVSGQHHPDRAPVIIRQGLDTHQLVESVTRWSTTASPRIHQVLARALDTAMAPPGGPVLLELREDVAAATAADRAEDWPLLQADSRTYAVAGTPDRQAIPAQAVELIARAQRPVLVVGGTCPADPSTRRALRDLSEALAAPVFTSPAAMGVLAPDADWFTGTFMNGNLEADMLSRGDLVLTVGLDAKDFFNAAWRYAAPVVAVNEHPDTQRFAPTSLQLVGPTCTTLTSLACIQSASAWSTADVARYRTSFGAPFHLDDGGFTIPSALRLARSLLPPETRVAVDAGFGKPLTSYLWSADEPGHYFTAHGLSTMGYALPAANALCLGFGAQPVVGFMGDGSLLMRASEISVAAEHGLTPIYVAWMDGALAQIETKQLRQSLRPVGARLPAVSCAKIADAFGGKGVDVSSLDEFRDALTGALAARVPTLIGARVDQAHRGEWYELLRG